MNKLLLILILIPALLFSQTRKQRKALAAQRKADQQVTNNFIKHSQNLGNNANLISKDKASVQQYISNQFKTIGLQQKGTNGYIQPFKIDAGKHIKANTFLKVNGTLLAVKKDYYPLSYSAQKSITGMPAMALREKGVPWFIDVKDWLEADSKNPAIDINKKVQKEAERAAIKGATALFVYNSSNIADNLRFNNKDKTRPLPLPVIYITFAGFNKYFNDQSQILDIELNVAFEEIIKNANNIAGYIDNGAASNIIIAAPYDFFNEESEIAGENQSSEDTVDIVSGPSMLIELARMLAVSKFKSNNYTFIAYSGEKLMAQTTRWINSSSITSPANYIINLNNVGRYDNNKKLLIEGYGTSTNWMETIKSLADNNLEISNDSSNLKRRDTSVHYARVPVLSFFTGAKNNYDKTSSATSKMNYEGEMHITKFIFRLIEASNTKGKLDFAQNDKTLLPQIKIVESAVSSAKENQTSK